VDEDDWMLADWEDDWMIADDWEDGVVKKRRDRGFAP